MEMQGNRTLAVGRQKAWDAINDPEVLKACIPGCERMDVTGPGQYTALIAVRVGPVAARFNGKVALSDVNAPESCTIGFDGQGGAAGFGRGSAKVRLTPQGEGCELAYDVQAQVGGKIAQVGQRLVDGVARAMAEDFFKRFDAEMARRHPAPAPPAGATMPATSAAATGAGEEPGAVRRVAVPGWAWVAGAVVIAGVAWWLLRT